MYNAVYYSGMQTDKVHIPPSFVGLYVSDDIKTLGANNRREKEITESKENDPSGRKTKQKLYTAQQLMMMVCSVAGVARPARNDTDTSVPKKDASLLISLRQRHPPFSSVFYFFISLFIFCLSFDQRRRSPFIPPVCVSMSPSMFFYFLIKSVLCVCI